MKKPTVKQILEGIEGILIMNACFLTFFLNPLRSRWGLTKKEAEKNFPGDDIVKDPKAHFTHGIEIDAPTEFVWPWIAQIGRGKGGFYSYELLENIAGLDIYNSENVLPQYQNPQIGDEVGFGPKDAYPIILCVSGTYMAIENWFDFDTQSRFDPKERSSNNYMHLSWLWYVEDIGKNRSRFISRNRVDLSASSKKRFLLGVLIEPIVFAMDRKMCLGIKSRAEQLFRSNNMTIKA